MRIHANQPRRARGSSLLSALLIAAVLSLAACSDDRDDSGRLDLRLTGYIPAALARHAWIEVSGVTAGNRNGERIQIGFDQPRRIDLAKLAGGATVALVRDAELPTGDYDWLDLHLNTRGQEDTYLIAPDNSPHEWTVPSGEDHPLRVTTPFHVPANGRSQRTIVFDLPFPMQQTGPTEQSYLLAPWLRSVANDRATTIHGRVARALIDDRCQGPHGAGLAVYIFSGNGIEADDMDSNLPNPMAIAAVTAGDDDEPLGFTAPFLPPARYSVGLSCHADDDRPDQDDAIVFIATHHIDTRDGGTVEAVFEQSGPS